MSTHTPDTPRLPRRALPAVLGAVVVAAVAAPSPAAAQTSSVVGSVGVTVESCRQLVVTAAFSGDDDGDGATSFEIGAGSGGPWTTACAVVTGPSPRECVVPSLSPTTTYWVRVDVSDPDGVVGTDPQVVGPATTPTCGADQVAPTVLFQSPAAGAIVGGTERFKVQVWDQGGLAVSPVRWSVDGGAPAVATASASYDCGDGCLVFEFDVETSLLTAGDHGVTVVASDAAGNTATRTLAIVVQNRGDRPAGSGQLLRRSHGSQTCIDCHALPSHSSQHAGTRYGNWAVDCLTCHTPHQTRNIYLVREALRTPASGEATVDFRVDDRSGGSNPQWSYLGDMSGPDNSPYDDGICEACHTRTNHYRNDSSGGDHQHNAGTRCVGCHPHSRGFSAVESQGCLVDPVAYSQCSSCHPTIWQRMTGQVGAVSRHALGAIVGVNDSCTDGGQTWSEPLADAVVPDDRSCVTMCHQDHVHNQVGGSDHAFNVHQDATTPASRAVTRDVDGAITAGTPTRTDFEGGAANGGLCVSCHRFAVDAARPAVPKAGYQASAHNYVTNSVGATTFAWSYTLHDGTVFERNCTKCHAGTGDAAPDASASPFAAVHFSDDPSLLAGNVNPGGGNAGSHLCYVCHGSSTTGADRSGKNIAAQVVKTARHPVNDDLVHDSAAELASAAFGNALGGAGRHVNCLDCHQPHVARAGAHANPGNTAGPPLEGAWGASLTTPPAFWTDTTAASFSQQTIVAGTGLEATLCFKCHTRYYWGSGIPPTSPSGGFAETDVAKEFNPNNRGDWGTSWASGETAGGFHPVLATAAGNLGAVRLTNLVSANGLSWSTSARNLMTCSDCHESNNVADPNGPHGSTAGFLLRGPNTTWNASIGPTGQNAFMPAGTFCLNCHRNDSSTSRFNAHQKGDHGSSRGVRCFSCHAAVPHGGPRPGMLVAGAGAVSGVGGTIAGWDDSAVYEQGPSGDKLYLKSYPSSATGGWQEANCGCNGTNH